MSDKDYDYNLRSRAYAAIEGLFEQIEAYAKFRQVNWSYDDLRLPYYATQGAAGMDLFSPVHTTIHVGSRALIKIGWAVEITPGWYGRIAPRSGMAWKDGIEIMAGVIDSDYRDEIGVILINHGQVPKQINAGDRIAQMIIEKCARAVISKERVLSEVQNRHAGFGSTGA